MGYKEGQHCADEDLELYSLGHLDDDSSEFAFLEEHLLICDGCRVRLDEADRYVRAMRSATLRLRAEERRSVRPSFSLSWFRLPAFSPAWAGAAACLGLVLVSAPWTIGRQRGAEPVSVSLLAERGGGNTVSARHPLRVSLDARGLELGTSAHLLLVDGHGAAVESTEAPLRANRIEAVLARPLEPGEYYLRIFRDKEQDPVREFSLTVR